MFPKTLNRLTPALISHSDWSDRYLENRDHILSALGRLGSGLAEFTVAELSDALTVIKSYYSNSMEGNPTKVGDIFKAKDGVFSEVDSERHYELEHMAHIEVSSCMIKRLNDEPDLSPLTKDFLCYLHREFYERLPEAMRFAHMHEGNKVSLIPGKLRNYDASVGSHVTPSPSEIASLLNEFEILYRLDAHRSVDYLSLLAASHHRFLWIHPFLDGNGRVVRLMTEAIAYRLNFYGRGLYSIARGFARSRKLYDKSLEIADMPRKGNYDGRSNLSKSGLINWSEYFLEVMRDQVTFMEGFLKKEVLLDKYEVYLANLQIRKKITNSERKVLLHIFHVGELARGEVKAVAGLAHAQGARIIKKLLDMKLIKSPSPKGRLYWSINSEVAKSILDSFFT